MTNRLQQPSLSAFGVVHNTFNRQPEPDPPLSALFQPPAPSQPMHMTYVPPASTQVFLCYTIILCLILNSLPSWSKYFLVLWNSQSEITYKLWQAVILITPYFDVHTSKLHHRFSFTLPFIMKYVFLKKGLQLNIIFKFFQI